MAWWPSRSGSSGDAPAEDVDQALADLSQSLADRDQTASDDDATASERDSADSRDDEASSDSDQRASDADQMSSDRLLAAVDQPTADERHVYDESRDQRAHATQRREHTHGRRAASDLDRIESDAARFETSARRDDVAVERDRAADLREGAARRSEAALLAAYPDNAALRAVVAANSELRDKAMVDRRRAAVDRQRAAEDRLVAAAAQRRARIDVQQAQITGTSGIFARQLGHAALSGEIDRCRRTDDPFVLAYLSIDGLRDTNARQGVAAGDALIGAVVRALRENLRSYDPVVRVAGDEFLCGLSGAEARAAHERIDEIRSTVRHGHPPGTVSVGFAVLEGGDTLGSLIARAEASMKLDQDAHHGR